MQYKQTALIVTSVLGLSLAVTGCSTANSQTTTVFHHFAKQGDKQPKGEKKQHWGKKMKADTKGMMGRFMAELNLTDAQKTQIQTLRQQNQARMQQIQATLKQYDDTITAQKKAGASTTTLLALHQQKQHTMQQFFTLRQQQHQQLMAILTPEQQLKFYERHGSKQDIKPSLMGGMKPHRHPNKAMTNPNDQQPLRR